MIMLQNKKSWFGRLKGVKLSRLWRTVFAALLCCYILFLLYSIFQQASSPWELTYHAYFMEELYPWMSISAEWVTVLACSFAIKGILHESMGHRRWIWYSWFTGLVLAIFFFPGRTKESLNEDRNSYPIKDQFIYWTYYLLLVPREICDLGERPREH